MPPAEDEAAAGMDTDELTMGPTKELAGLVELLPPPTDMTTDEGWATMLLLTALHSP